MKIHLELNIISGEPVFPKPDPEQLQNELTEYLQKQVLLFKNKNGNFHFVKLKVETSKIVEYESLQSNNST